MKLPLGFGIAADNECVYIAGGFDDNGMSQVIQKFNTKSNHVRNLTPMLEKRSCFGLVHCEYFSPTIKWEY